MSESDRAPVDLRLVPAALSAWLVTAAGIRWQTGPVLVAATLLVLLAAMVAGHRLRRAPGRTVAVAVAAASAVSAGFALAITLRNHAVAHHPLAGCTGQTVSVVMTPSESPREISSGRVLLKGPLLSVGGTEIGGLVTVFAPSADYGQVGVGQPVGFRARVGKPDRRDLSVAVLIATGRPTLGRAPPAQRVAQRIRERFATAATVLPDGPAAMLPGLILGDTSAVTASTTAEFRATGLTHLMAVSGANVSIVVGAVVLVAGLAGPRIAVLAAAPALTGFVLVVQPSASVVRAAVMGTIGLLAVVTARPRNALPALAAAVLVLLILAPQLAVDIGFVLSAAATAGLVLVAPGWSRRLTARGWPKPLADAVAVCTAAQLCTAPLIAALTGTFSVVAVAANLAVTAVVAPITVAGTAAAALTGVWPAAATVLIRAVRPLVWWVLAVAHYGAAAPAAVLAVPSGPAGFLFVGAATVLGALGVRHLRLRAHRRDVGAA